MKKIGSTTKVRICKFHNRINFYIFLQYKLDFFFLKFTNFTILKIRKLELVEWYTLQMDRRIDTYGSTNGFQRHL